ncbi:MAG: class I SAM-dependent methyltransferase, partial [Granulosicoccus sp.]
RILDKAGLRLWAVDSSPTLVAEFRARFPHVPVQCARAQESTFFEKKYDGAIAVGLVFLLPESEQSALISRIARILVQGGRFLFTAPIETGNWIDRNTGLTCCSPGQRVYEEYLSRSGFRIINTFADAGANNYYDVVRVQ